MPIRAKKRTVWEKLRPCVCRRNLGNEINDRNVIALSALQAKPKINLFLTVCG